MRFTLSRFFYVPRLETLILILRITERGTSSKGEHKKVEMAGIGPLTQDWEPVVIRKKAPNAAAKKDEKAVNAARRAGAEIETVKKCALAL